MDTVAAYYYGDVATYTCTVGHETIHPGPTLVCQADQTWNGTAPTCARVGMLIDVHLLLK